MTFIPYRLCCGQQHSGPVCPDGLVMCEICYERFETKDLWVDYEGFKWSLCKECGDLEAVNREMIRICEEDD